MALNKKRNWLLSILIIISLLIAIPSFAIQTFYIFKAMNNVPQGARIFMLIPVLIGALHDVALIAIWFMKKWGVILYFVCILPVIGIMFFHGMPAIYKASVFFWVVIMVAAILPSWNEFE